MIDSNGNFITLNYKTGNSAGYSNSSARLDTIYDVRSTGSPTYTFTYNADSTPHLTAISNSIGTAENFTFTYSGQATLYSPFSPQVAFGSTKLLQTFTVNGLAQTHNFEYGSLNSGELSRVIFPYAGDLRWDYRAFTYGNTHQLREVQYRRLTKANGSPVGDSARAR